MEETVFWPIVRLSRGAEHSECAAYDDLDPTSQAMIDEMAIRLLWNWSGRKYGLTVLEVRPTWQEVSERAPTFTQIPVCMCWRGPRTVGQPWVRCGGETCGLEPGDTLYLPDPVESIEQVFIHGVELVHGEDYLTHESAVHLKDRNWPKKNFYFGDLDDEDTAAWGVVYTAGYPVPDGGQLAAGVLSCELAKAMAGDNTCKLPSRVQSISRQGVSMTILDEFGSLNEGRTGIWQIDAWLSSEKINQGSVPQVWSPDIVPSRGQASSQGWGVK